MPQKLRDNRGNLIGTITTRSSGRREGHNHARHLMGVYDPKKDETRDQDDTLVGYGDQLSYLLVSDWRDRIPGGLP
jgi:hypothetical protein